MKKIIGIDLGTTNSLVAYHTKNNTEIIKDRHGNKFIPSVVTLLDNKTVIVGQRAKELHQSNYQNTIYSAKRFIGQTLDDFKGYKLPEYIKADEHGHLKAVLNNTLYDIPEISASILKEAKKRADDFLQESINSCVITVPAYFNDNQRKATARAGQIAGLTVEKIINEPTAAALAYGLNKKNNQTIAVYDLGGGTFDISILKLRDGIFDVLSTNGNTRLGGDDFDQAIVDFFCNTLNIDMSNLKFETKEYLRNLAENAKVSLSESEKVRINISNFEIEATSIELSHADLNDIISPLLKETYHSVKMALKDADLSFTEIDEVIMVGGSTKSPIVQKAVHNWFNKKPHTDINPDEVVAIGAAIQASILEGEILNTVLLDITPLSLGMETIGGVTEKFIMRNTKIPCAVTQTFTTSKDNQSSVKINIVQGERELIKDNISLGEFTLKNVTPKPAGIPRIDVTFRLDSNGILKVNAVDTSSGTSEEITVETMKSLTDEKVESMLFESLKNAKEDVSQRLLIDAQNEARAIINSTISAMKNHHKLIDENENARLKTLIKNLEDRISTEKTHKSLMEHIDSFDKETEFFAERIMNQSIKQVVENQNINKFE